ncbi:hypothetical protein AMELA_G00095060, partial [Ameiurus melas]
EGGAIFASCVPATGLSPQYIWEGQGEPGAYPREHWAQVIQSFTHQLQQSCHVRPIRSNLGFSVLPKDSLACGGTWARNLWL